jgi:hypothetical protein
MPKRGLIILGVVVLLGIALFFGIRGLVTDKTQSLADAGDQFMRAVQNHDMTAAFNMLAPDFQAKLGQERFQDIFVDAKVASWSFDSRTMDGDNGKLSGTAAIDDMTFKLEFQFRQQDGQWQLTAYDFNQ